MAPAARPLLRSFWMAGYECTDQLNAFGHRVDLLTATGHLDRLAADYADLAAFGIRSVREGIRWSHVERQPYHYDWRTVETMMAIGQQQGVQQVWDLCHFGYPDDLTPLHPMFARRFAALCRRFLECFRRQHPTGPLVLTPINEVSFISWLGGDARGTSPYCVGQGWEVKYALMRAYVEGVAALKALDPDVVVLSTEPLVSVVPPFGASEAQVQEAARHHAYQFQATDMLTGRQCPELGGQPDFLDVLGFNYYYDNQWELGKTHILPWQPPVHDPRYRPPHQLMLEAAARYDRPFVLTETSHPGEDRPDWIRHIGRECSQLLAQGAPLLGVCIYPIIDRPDWDFPDRWHHSGLWDHDPLTGRSRLLHHGYAQSLQAAQRQCHQASLQPA